MSHTCGLGAGGRVGAKHGDTQQGVGARRVLVHVGGGGGTVLLAEGKHL